MATSSAMKSSLVLLLVLSAVVASQAHEVSCKNTCKSPIWLNDILVLAGQSVTLVDVDVIALVVVDIDGVKHSGHYKCPEDVSALIFLYVDGVVKVKIAGVLDLIGGLLHSVLGAVVDLISCTLAH